MIQMQNLKHGMFLITQTFKKKDFTKLMKKRLKNISQLQK